MTHDPLCPTRRPFTAMIDDKPVTGYTLNHCCCALLTEARVDERDNTLDDAINLLEEMNCKRLWWDDMLTWCISVNEAIYNIDNLRGKREGI